MDDGTKLYICLEAKHDNGGQQHQQQHVYLICSLKLNDLTTKRSDLPILIKETSFEGNPSMGCGFYQSKIVFAGGQLQKTDVELAEQPNHNGLITFDMNSKQLSSNSFPSMLRGKLKPLVFQLHDNLYVMDTVSGYRQGSFEYFYPKTQQWNHLLQPAYDSFVDELACQQDRNYPCLVFGNTCYLAISVPSYNFVYLHHPNITYKSWYIVDFLMPYDPLPFSGVATFCHHDDANDFMVISFTNRDVRIHYFDLSSASFLQTSKILFSLPSSSESGEPEEMSGYFADFGDGIFSLTAFDTVRVHVCTFQILSPDNPEVFQWLSHYEYKCDALSFEGDIIGLVGCFAPYPNVRAIKHADKLFENRFDNFAKRCDEDPTNFEFDGVKFPVPEGCPGGLVFYPMKKSPAHDPVDSWSAPIKVQTVVGYILDAARQGCAIDWMRFSEEIGLTQEAFINIQVAIMKVGSKDKLKPIKDELPEEVSYTHITVVLTMVDLGLTRDALAANHRSGYEANECSKEMAEIPKQLDILSHAESKICKLKEPVNCMEDHLSSEEKNKTVSRMQEFDDQQSLRKGQKVDPQENLVSVEATDDSIIEWLGNFENGVSLPDFVEHFNGLTVQVYYSVVELSRKNQCLQL